MGMDDGDDTLDVLAINFPKSETPKKNSKKRELKLVSIG